MRVLYISSTNSGMHQSSIYFDLMQEFVSQGHDVYIAYAREKRLNKPTLLYKENNITYLGIKTMNMTKNKNKIEKGIATLSIDWLFQRGFKKYFNDTPFDLVLYSTPPITFSKSLDYLKKVNPNAEFFLMLKDIFPQNAVDLGMMSEGGKMHNFFVKKEHKLYEKSDYIGVMSPANRQFFEKHNPEFSHKLSILPNAIALKDIPAGPHAKKEDFGLDNDDFVLFFGGNLGEPQCIPFIIECAKRITNPHIKMVIAGSGSQQSLIEAYANEHPETLKYFGQLPGERYNQLASTADVGLIFLDKRFTIPNFPQRVLSYMESRVPVICATDNVSDVGDTAQQGSFGYKVISDDADAWYDRVEYLYNNPELLKQMGDNGYAYLVENFQVTKSYKVIMDEVLNNKHS